MENRAVNMRKTDLFNAKNNSRTIKDFLDKSLVVSGAAVVANGATSQSGTPCDVGYIATNEGIIGFTSNVCLSAMPEFMDLLEDILNTGDVLSITFFEGKTNSGKPYYNFTASIA